jgi:hypothetical protein
MVVIASSKRYSDFNASSHGRIKQHIDAVISYAYQEQNEQPLEFGSIPLRCVAPPSGRAQTNYHIPIKWQEYSPSKDEVR